MSKEHFVEFVRKHEQYMYKIAGCYLDSEEDIADAIQNTILKCFEKMDSIKNKRYEKTWMTRVLINECMDILRQKKRMLPYENLIETEYEDTGLKQYEWQELLDKIDEKYRVILIMHYCQGFKVTEISRILGLNPNTVITRLSRGKKLLRRELERSV